MVRAGHLRLYACLPVLIFSDQSLLGFLVVLFFRCMAALFDPIHRRGERTNWWLVSYTVFMFLAATAQTAMAFYLRMSSYVDNREFPAGFESTTPPGPLGYESLSFKDALVIVDDVMFYLGTWLADGLLVNTLFISVFTLVANARLSSSTAATSSSTLRTSGLLHSLPRVPRIFWQALDFVKTNHGGTQG